ncbi:SdrD B-like domain-containing protein [Oceanithermus sp.]|uniref:SdrD B-like domain-containing protein n=1 Tax=Oceanithermus sp. TaxID=2268145 RepID=UPI0025EAEE2D|nr:SdrD B-like domain-containing protein [Oceanithermus sp.]
MRALLALLALWAGATWALALEAPARLEVDDGAFASLAVVLDRDGDRLEVAAPEGFLLVSRPRPQAGRQLVNFFVERGTPSGTYDLRLSLWSGERVVEEARVRVFVRPRAGVAVAAPTGRRIVLGQQATYWVRVTNTGNVADRIRFEIRTPERGAALEPASLELAPGASESVRLTVTPRSAQPLVVVLRARSSFDPRVERFVSVRTDVLPFAEADRLGARSLRYRLDLEAGTGSQGFTYGANAAVAGGLSDYVRGAAAGRYAPGAPGLSLALEGAEGRLDFSAGTGGYEWSVARGAWSGGLRYRDGAWSGRLAWDVEPWSLGLYAGATHQRFSLDYRWRPLEWWSVEAGAGLDRYAPGGAEQYAAAGRLRLGLDSPTWLASLRVVVDAAGLHLDGSFTRRADDAFGLRGYGFYNPGELALSLGSSQRLGGPWEAREAMSYFRGALGWSAGVRYAREALPWSVGAGLAGGGDALTVRLDGRYDFEEGPVLSGWLAWDPERGLQEGLNYRLGEGATRVELYYDDSDAPRLGARLDHGWSGWSVTGSYALRLDDLTGEGSGAIEYDAGRWVGYARVEGDAQRFAWSLGARWRLEGGVATPEPVVQLFGGRKTGRVEGVVFADLNGDGRIQEDEPPVIGAYLSCGSLQAMSGAEGRYVLEAPPGDCALSAEDASGQYGLTAPLELRFERNRTERLDVPLVPVAGVSGVVWLDRNGDGVRDEGERALGGAVVELAGPDGKAHKAYSDGRGRFQLGGLPPGRYVLRLGSEGLPRGYVPGAPQELELRPGPLPFVEVAAVPRPQERVRTFSVGDAALFVQAARDSAPPGAEVRVVAEVTGPQPEEVWLEAGGRRVAMEPEGEGRYAGYLALPADARGVFSYAVRARWGRGELEQQGLIVVKPGPLARLEVRPAFVDPGETVEVTARFLRRVQAPEVRLGGEAFALEPVDAFAWRVRITAPQTPGRYTIELWAGGERWAVSAFRVSE